MSFSRKFLGRFTILVIVPTTLTQCANQEVTQTLDQKLQVSGESYTKELAAQSPFKKVELTWSDATDLMEKRNPHYRQAIIDKETSAIRRGFANNLTYEVRKSLSNSVQSTLNPGEIALAMKDPVTSFPRQLESITDLKNISHSLSQSEWQRVTQSVRADAVERREIVNLHVLFCQSENLKNAQQDLKSMMEAVSKDAAASQNKELRAALTNAQATLKSEREQWLNQVRDFFNAEYYDVELNNYKGKLSFYRDVTDPEFSDWKRWRMLENSDRLAEELRKQHSNQKPLLPGVSLISNNLGVNDFKENLVQQSTLNESMAKEVRQMIKNWRNLKSLQQNLVQQEQRLSQSRTKKIPSLVDVKTLCEIFDLKKREVEQLKAFWVIDEKCWNI